MQFARHLVKGFCKQAKLIRQAGIQRRRVELPVFNTLTGGNQLIQRGNHLMAYAAQSKKTSVKIPMPPAREIATTSSILRSA